jgi:hypothetical protein
MGGYPAVFMHDGQNLFTPDLCASMTCWQVSQKYRDGVSSCVHAQPALRVLSHPCHSSVSQTVQTENRWPEVLCLASIFCR